MNKMKKEPKATMKARGRGMLNMMERLKASDWDGLKGKQTRTLGQDGPKFDKCPGVERSATTWYGNQSVGGRDGRRDAPGTQDAGSLTLVTLLTLPGRGLWRCRHSATLDAKSPVGGRTVRRDGRWPARQEVKWARAPRPPPTGPSGQPRAPRAGAPEGRIFGFAVQPVQRSLV